MIRKLRKEDLSDAILVCAFMSVGSETILRLSGTAFILVTIG